MAEGSVLQGVVTLYNSNCMLFAIFLIVHTLCNQLLEYSVYSIHTCTLQECYRHIEDVHA